MTAEPTRAAVAAALDGLDRDAIADARWFGAKGQSIRAIELEEAFVLDAAAGHTLAVARLELDGSRTERSTFALTGDPPRPAGDGEGVWRALAMAIEAGRIVPSLGVVEGDATDGDTPPSAVSAALVCRPTAVHRSLVDDLAGGVRVASERPLGLDQTNTSAVIGERLLVKVYRRLEPGLNPELELVAFLTEDAGFAAVPPLAGYAEMVSRTTGTSTIAIVQAYVADAADGYETTADTLADWILAPGEVSVEFATEIAADLGALTAGLHAALADGRRIPEIEPHEASRDELRDWGRAARIQLARAVDVTPGEAGRELADLKARIAAELTVFEALSAPPLLTRIHGDYHLGQILLTPDGYRVVDFEGEPLRPLEERRAHNSPLRDVASMLRSFDHVGRAAGRRAEARNGGPVPSPGLDLPGWLQRSRVRFLAAYRAGLREAGAPITVDPALIRALEIDKETYEFVYASTYLPSWLWAPTEGMRWLLDSPDARLA